MNRTKIEWVFNPDGTRPGWTWNPLTGCLNHTNGLCKGGNFPCYAYRLANGRLKQRYLANPNIAEGRSRSIDDRDKYEDPFYPRFWPDRLEHKAFNLPHKPCGVFVCDMGELFGDWIPKEWQEQVFHSIRVSQSDRFYLLTKQPQNLIKWSPFPSNCWVGVTATNNAAMTNAYYGLNRLKAGKRFISFEPLLGQIGVGDHVNIKSWLDWVIIGCQTKPLKLPKFEWVEEIVSCADKVGIPVFIKPPLSDVMHYRRQELPD
jgi:protein gp37